MTDPNLPIVSIDYCRLPDQYAAFKQACVFENDEVIVTYAERSGIQHPKHLEQTIILEPDSPVVWFTFPNQWHDIGRFHRADGTFTGLYANIITPIERITRYHWSTTDLFLDLWIADDRLVLLDEDDLLYAEVRKHISEEDGIRARQEVFRLQCEWEDGKWPPPIVQEWTLERARRVAHGTRRIGLV